jgi:hypothetical protein
MCPLETGLAEIINRTGLFIWSAGTAAFGIKHIILSADDFGSVALKRHLAFPVPGLQATVQYIPLLPFLRYWEQISPSLRQATILWNFGLFLFVAPLLSVQINWWPQLNVQTVWPEGWCEFRDLWSSSQ